MIVSKDMAGSHKVNRILPTFDRRYCRRDSCGHGAGSKVLLNVSYLPFPSQCIELRNVKILGGYYSSGNIDITVDLQPDQINKRSMKRKITFEVKGVFRLITSLSAEYKQMLLSLVVFMYHVHARVDTSISRTS